MESVTNSGSQLRSSTPSLSLCGRVAWKVTRSPGSCPFVVMEGQEDPGSNSVRFENSPSSPSGMQSCGSCCCFAHYPSQTLKGSGGSLHELWSTSLSSTDIHFYEINLAEHLTESICIYRNYHSIMIISISSCTIQLNCCLSCIAKETCWCASRCYSKHKY